MALCRTQVLVGVSFRVVAQAGKHQFVVKKLTTHFQLEVSDSVGVHAGFGRNDIVIEIFTQDYDGRLAQKYLSYRLRASVRVACWLGQKMWRFCFKFTLCGTKNIDNVLET